MATENLPDQHEKTVFSWTFEAKGIQRWLFSGGRLRDIVGGSDLVSRIATTGGSDLLALASDECGLVVCESVDARSAKEAISFSRRAGGAFYVHCNSRDTLIALRKAFLRRFLSALPGLEYQDALGQGEDEIASRDNAFAVRGGARGNALASVLPLGRPVFAVNPRSGLPQCGSATYSYGSEENVVPLDRCLAPQRHRADILQERFATGLSDRSNLTRFIVDGAALRFHSRTGAKEVFAYPRNLADDEEDKLHNPLFPWIESATDRRIGLVHADISGLGQVFQNASVGNARQACKLAEDIEEAILAAVGKAAADVLLPAASEHTDWGRIVPARPLVVGGDDITVLIRADLAVPFAVALLRQIEHATRNIGGGLSACAGVAISSRSQPFLALNTLTESLCSFAKAKAKSQPPEGGSWPSLMAFHVHAQSAEEEYADDILPHLCAPGLHPLAANPYAIDKAAGEALGCATWDRLAGLADGIRAVRGAEGAFRGIRSELAKGPLARLDNANARWRRFWSRGGLDELAGAVAEAAGVTDISAMRDTIPKAGVLFDALELIDLEKAARGEFAGATSVDPVTEIA